MAAAAAITPVVAQADSFAPLAPSLTSFAKALGSTAGSGVCDVTSGVDCTSAVNAAVVASKQASATGDTIFKNNITWWGGPTLPGPTQNANYWNDPKTIITSTWTPLNAFLFLEPLIPGVFAWWNSQSSQSCVLGITTSLGGPYSAAGTFTSSYNRSGCNPS
jgi:hypothetical protein